MVTTGKEFAHKYKIAIRIIIVLSMIFVTGCVASEANNTPANDQKHSNQSVYNTKEQNLASCLVQKSREFVKARGLPNYQYPLAAAYAEILCKHIAE